MPSKPDLSLVNRSLFSFYLPDMGHVIFGRNFGRNEMQNAAVLSQFMLNEDKDQGKRKRPEPPVVSSFGLYLLGAPGMIRTCDTRIRNPVLYPLSYGGNMVELQSGLFTLIPSPSQDFFLCLRLLLPKLQVSPAVM